MKKKKTEAESRALRVLILEDNAADAELVVHELRRTKINGEFLLVEDKKGFSEALAGFRPQVILSDFKLPGFDGLEALEMARQQAPDTPFIFVSGSIGEEKAIETLSLGASDYIFKDNLKRLGPAVRRVVADAELRLQKKITEAELNRHVEQLRILAEAADRFVHINDLEEAFKYLSRTICEISEAPYLLLSQYDDKMQALRPRIAVGFEPFEAAIGQHLGSELMQMSFRLEDMRPDVFSDFISRRLLPVRNGLFGFFNEKISRQNCKAIEKLLAVNAIFTMGFSWENQLFGGVALFFKTGSELKNNDQVEALVNLAAVAIKRLRSERSLRESEEKYRLIADNTAETITILDMNFQFTYVSPSIVKLRGYTVEETQAQTLAQVLTADSLAQISVVFNEEMALEASGNADPKRSRTLELQEYCKDGSIVWVENSLSFLRDADGRAVGLLSVSKDISERKRVEEEIRQQKAFLEKLIEAAPEGIAITDRSGRIRQVNSEFSNMFGFASTEAVGKMIDELIAPPGFAEEANGLTSASGSGQKVVLETVRKKKDGSLFNVSIIGAPIFIAEQQVAVYAIYRDISERKRNEEQLLYQADLLQTVSDAIIATDANGIIRMWNRAAETIYGWKTKEALNMPIHQLLSPTYRLQERSEIFEKLGSDGAWSGEIIHHHRDGRPITIQSSITNLKGPGGEPAGMVSINSDISERKRAEAEFLRERVFLEKLVETAPEGIVIADNQGRVLKVNSEFVRMFGYDFDEAPGKLIDDMVVPPQYREEAQTLNKSVGEGKKAVLESVRSRKDGSLLHVSIIIAPIHIEGEQVAVYAIYRDITERKRSEELVYASLKEKEVLLQEIHHRVKNNLQIVSGLLTLQADHGEGKTPGEMFLESQGRIRTIALVHEKLYRSHNLAEIAFDDYLRALAEDLLNSLGAAGRIRIAFETERVLFSIEKAVPLGLIVNELVTNALKHAFPGKRMGEIRISLQERRGVKFYAPTDENHSPTYELTIADDGIGLPAGFDPAAQKSLGMKLVAMLALQLQAELKVTPGPGAEFQLLFSNPLLDWNTKDESKPGGI